MSIAGVVKLNKINSSNVVMKKERDTYSKRAKLYNACFMLLGLLFDMYFFPLRLENSSGTYGSFCKLFIVNALKIKLRMFECKWDIYIKKYTSYKQKNIINYSNSHVKVNVIIVIHHFMSSNDMINMKKIYLNNCNEIVQDSKQMEIINTFDLINLMIAIILKANEIKIKAE